MIALFANWTGNALTMGATAADAMSKLRPGLDCQPGTTIGSGLTDITALDVGNGYRYVEHLPPLHRAIQIHPEVEG